MQPSALQPLVSEFQLDASSIDPIDIHRIKNKHWVAEALKDMIETCEHAIETGASNSAGLLQIKAANQILSFLNRKLETEDPANLPKKNFTAFNWKDVAKALRTVEKLENPIFSHSQEVGTMLFGEKYKELTAACNIPKYIDMEALLDLKKDKAMMKAIADISEETMRSTNDMADDYQRHSAKLAAQYINQLQLELYKVRPDSNPDEFSELFKSESIGWSLRALGKPRRDKELAKNYADVIAPGPTQKLGEYLFGESFHDKTLFKLPFNVYQVLQSTPVPARSYDGVGA